MRINRSMETLEGGGRAEVAKGTWQIKNRRWHEPWPTNRAAWLAGLGDRPFESEISETTGAPWSFKLSDCNARVLGVPALDETSMAQLHPNVLYIYIWTGIHRFEFKIIRILVQHFYHYVKYSIVNVIFATCGISIKLTYEMWYFCHFSSKCFIWMNSIFIILI